MVFFLGVNAITPALFFQFGYSGFIRLYNGLQTILTVPVRRFEVNWWSNRFGRGRDPANGKSQNDKRKRDSDYYFFRFS